MGTAAPVFGGCRGGRDTITEIGAIPPEAHAARTVDAADMSLRLDLSTSIPMPISRSWPVRTNLPKVMQGVTTEVFPTVG